MLKSPPHINVYFRFLVYVLLNRRSPLWWEAMNDTYTKESKYTPPEAYIEKVESKDW